MTAIHYETNVLDLWELLNRCMGKPELAARVIQRFQKQLQGDLDKIAAALNGGNIEAARESAHRLKGAAANVAAHGLKEQAHALESAIQLELAEQYELVFQGLLAERDRFVETAAQVQFS
jgi:HPt (histidine-containing phosphotransfer) domain-containing protein